MGLIHMGNIKGFRNSCNSLRTGQDTLRRVFPQDGNRFPDGGHRFHAHALREGDAAPGATAFLPAIMPLAASRESSFTRVFSGASPPSFRRRAGSRYIRGVLPGSGRLRGDPTHASTAGEWLCACKAKRGSSHPGKGESGLSCYRTADRPDGFRSPDHSGYWAGYSVSALAPN